MTLGELMLSFSRLLSENPDKLSDILKYPVVWDDSYDVTRVRIDPRHDVIELS
jgi:hypothetical protein